MYLNALQHLLSQTLYMWAKTWNPEPQFTKRYDVLPPNLVMSPIRGIGCYKDCSALKFGRQLGRAATECAYQISERLEKSEPECHGFKTK